MVLGMHRSGTSAVTRICNQLGAELGGAIIEAAPDNPKGFWENRDMVALHDQILRAINHPWDSVRPLADKWWLDTDLAWAREALRDLIGEHFSNTELWVVKDPRLCLLLPMWQLVLKELNIESKCLIVNRHPSDVAHSLAARDGYRAAHAHLLYLRYTLELEKHSRSNAGTTRAVLSYDQLLSDWRSEMEKISRQLLLDWPRSISEQASAIESELDPGLRHHFGLKDKEGKDDKTAEASPSKIEVHRLAADIHLALSNLDDEAGASKSQFNKIARRLKTIESRTTAWLEALAYQTGRNLEGSVLEQQAELEKLNAICVGNRAELDKLTELSGKQGAELELLDKVRGKQIVELQRLDALRIDLESQCLENAELIGSLSHEIQSIDKKLSEQITSTIQGKAVIDLQSLDITNLRSEIEQFRYVISEMLASTSWRLTAPLRWLTSKLAQRVKQVGELVNVSLKTIREPALLKELLQLGRSTLQRLGLREFIRRLPAYFNIVGRYTARKQVPETIETPTIVRMLPTSVPMAKDDNFKGIKILRPHPEFEERQQALEVSVSVVIPTYNAGEEFYWLLRKLSAQKGLKALEIVVVDSGSTDATVETAMQAGCVVVEISQAEFSHSYARNLGAGSAAYEYLLFMVQDAYPVGDYWAYGMAKYLQDHRNEKVVAVSCSEYCRTDSDVMYDCNVDTHYRFLNCREMDRIGELKGNDHMSLRAYGQLSDVSCLISSEVFFRYRYRGDYAEDLDLGIRLIRDDLRIAMLASVKTIHSHNRPAYYYLKRSFVDVIFLVRQFEDFQYPSVKALHGLMFGIVALGEWLTEYLRGYDFSASDTTVDSSMQNLIDQVKIYQDSQMFASTADPDIDLGDAEFSAYLVSLRMEFLHGQEAGAKEQAEAQAFIDGFVGRLVHFKSFANKIYLQQDAFLKREVFDMVRKTFAATAGSYLGFLYLAFKDEQNEFSEIVEDIKSTMGAGI